MPPLSKIRHERFAQSYVKDFNGKQAAISVGYKPSVAGKKAKELLALPQIQERLEELNNELLAELGINARYVLGKLKEMAEYGLEIKEYKRRDGSITLYRKDPKTAHAALELLGKHLKMWTEKVESSMTITTLASAFNSLDEIDAARNHKPAEPL